MLTFVLWSKIMCVISRNDVGNCVFTTEILYSYSLIVHNHMISWGTAVDLFYMKICKINILTSDNTCNRRTRHFDLKTKQHGGYKPTGSCLLPLSRLSIL